MSDAIIQAYHAVRAEIAAACAAAQRPSGSVTLVAVSKTHDAQTILPVLLSGHRVFGENRVQEAAGKWPALKGRFPDIELHLIGPLQSNKVAEAVALFDVIQSVDRDKLAAALAKEIRRQGRTPRLFAQVNTGSEPQKAGLKPQDVDNFLANARGVHGLKITGLMCIPPVDADPLPHFRLLAEIARRNGISDLSMGMSSDYVAAVAAGATYVRVGSAIFGARAAAHPPEAKSQGR